MPSMSSSATSTRSPTRHGLEKIKTIGDAYMAVAGAPTPMADHADAAVGMAVDILAEAGEIRWPSGDPIVVRGGIATGPAVAGVIGVQRFAYDLWGDTVNLASRLETNAGPGRFLVSESTAAAAGRSVRLRASRDPRGEGQGAHDRPRPARPPRGRPRHGAARLRGRMTATRTIARTMRGSASRAAAVVVVCTSRRGAPTPMRAGCGARPPERNDVIVVGVSGAFAENQIVAEMYAQVLEHAGYTVERQLDLRSREVSQNALEAGAIDREAGVPLVAAPVPRPERGGVRRCRRRRPADRRAAPVRRAHVAHTIGGRGHESVRGERGDGPAVRPDHDELPRPRRRPADVRRAAGMPPTALLPPGIARGLRDPLRRLHAAGRGRAADRRRAQERRGADRAAVLHRPEHRAERVRPARGRQAPPGRGEHHARDPLGDAERRGSEAARCGERPALLGGR